jgi:LysR family transcriptional regulator, glycine cleavage system transcriptional activator
MPPTKNLRAAIVVARLGSFSAAALELGLTHTAVGRRVALVEDWVGAPLFERHGRGVRPSVDGQRLLARLEAALGEIASLRPARSRLKVPAVRVAVTPAFARFWLLPRLRAIEGVPATVRIEVVASLRYADLARGEVDLAVRYGRGRWRTGTERQLFNEPQVPVIARQLLSTVAAVRPADILRYPLLHNADTTNWQAWTRTYWPAANAKPGDRIFADYALAIDAAACGLGVALWNQGLHGLPAGLVAFDDFRIETPLAYYLLARANDINGPPAEVAARILAATSMAGPK